MAPPSPAGSPPPEPLPGCSVQIRPLNHFFGPGDLRKQVLYDINLDLHQGEIAIMTGPSGSGKTTLLTLIGALRSVHQGSLHVLGQELTGLTPRQLVQVRRQIGFIFQAHNLFESLTAVQNVEMAVELSGNLKAKRQRATAMLAQVGLGDRADYRPAALSGGQKQRVAIARALVNHPRLILADEPTAALDKVSGRDVVTLMQQLAQQEHCTILMVTHDNRILDVAHRLINLVDGRLESDTKPQAFVASHTQPVDGGVVVM
ncbi:MAG: ATP-binding cassette domain-containing protein [Cyanobacteriota bacterium]|nr:ATP-binding cassette domain-containing protein [Cyanobacteriota bacterium]